MRLTGSLLDELGLPTSDRRAAGLGSALRLRTGVRLGGLLVVRGARVVRVLVLHLVLLALNVNRVLYSKQSEVKKKRKRKEKTERFR
jgi:hypothetical protein